MSRFLAGFDGLDNRIGPDHNLIIRINPRGSVAGFRLVHFAISLANELIQCLSIYAEGRGAYADSYPRKPVFPNAH